MSQDNTDKPVQKQLPTLEDVSIPTKKKAKIHPVFGEYVDVTVVALMDIDKKNTAYASVNAYTIYYKYNIKQSIPKLIVDFIKAQTQTERSYISKTHEDGEPYEEEIKEKTPRFSVIRH